MSVQRAQGPSQEGYAAGRARDMGPRSDPERALGEAGRSRWSRLRPKRGGHVATALPLKLAGVVTVSQRTLASQLRK